MIPETTDRQRRILARLVTEYIEQGEPVSSAWLAEHTDLGLSSASVRNILARLEEQGLVHQPHTSAGRVPTDSGYRLYVDGLLGSRKKGGRVQAEVEARLRRAGTVGDLLENASQELSRASQHIGFALDPASPSVRLRHVDFVRLDDTRVLVIVVSTGGQITHKVVEPPEAVRCGVAHAGGQLHQHRICRPHDSRGAHRRRRTAAAGAHPLRRAGQSRAAARQRQPCGLCEPATRCTCRARRC